MLSNDVSVMSKSLIKRPILGGQVNFPVCLAPMVGITHWAIRKAVRDYLPKDAKTIWPTEMLSSWSLPKEDLTRTYETHKCEKEDLIVPQILGNEEVPIQKSVEKLRDWGAVGIDINMGCPVKKALRHNYGVALMGDPAYAAEVVRITKKNSSLPVSVKLRAGLQNDRDFLLKFMEGLQTAGADWVTLHPRVAAQQRRGKADWEQLKFVRERLNIPVIGNGDIQIADDVFRMMNETSCDMVMVGRALVTRPWMLWQVGERLGFQTPSGRENEKAPANGFEEAQEGKRFLLQVIKNFKEIAWLYPEEKGLVKFRFLLRMTQGWYEFGHELWAISTRVHSFDQLEDGVHRFFESPQKMSSSTQNLG